MSSTTPPDRSRISLRRLGGSGLNRRRPLSARDVLIIGGVMAGIGGLITSCARSRPVGNPSVPEPAKPVDLSRYLGRWYEIARYESGFERDCEGVTADYSLRPDGMIRVLNICHKGSPEGGGVFCRRAVAYMFGGKGRRFSGMARARAYALRNCVELERQFRAQLLERNHSLMACRRVERQAAQFGWPAFRSHPLAGERERPLRSAL
jgi:hypothetical protein